MLAEMVAPGFGIHLSREKYRPGNPLVGDFTVSELADMCSRAYAPIPAESRMPLLTQDQFADRLIRYPNLVFAHGNCGKIAFLTHSDPVEISNTRYSKLGPIGFNENIRGAMDKAVLVKRLYEVLRSEQIDRTNVFCVMAPAKKSVISRILVSLLGFAPNQDEWLNDALLAEFVHPHGVTTETVNTADGGFEYRASDKPYPLRILLLDLQNSNS